MTVWAKSIIIKATTGAAATGGNPFVFVIITAASIAGAVCSMALSKKLRKRDTITVTLKSEYVVRKVHKQCSVWNVGEWKVYDYSLSVS